MQNLVFITPVRFDGNLLCRIPGCCGAATAHVDRYVRCSSDDGWWDARHSGPFCDGHLARIQSDWNDCEIRALSS